MGAWHSVLWGWFIMIDQKSKHIREEGIPMKIERFRNSYFGPAIISKVGKTLSDHSLQNKRMLNCLLESNLRTGELVSCGGTRYITTVSRKEIIQGVEVSIIAHGIACNALYTVVNSTVAYGNDYLPSGETITTVIKPTSCRAEIVTARMRQDDPGLLPTTLVRLYAPYNSKLKMLDKVTLGRWSMVTQPLAFLPFAHYQVDHIDRVQIPNAMVAQLGMWTAG